MEKFPPDDYYYDFNVSVSQSRVNLSANLPVVVFSKSSDNAVATARLRTSNNQENNSLFEHTFLILRGTGIDPI